MPYIGNTVQNQGFAPAIDYFSGNGVTVTFTLSRNIASVAQIICAIDNVIQNPSTAFTVSGNAITFTSAPLSGTNNIWVEYTSLITTYAAISQDPSVIGDITASGGYLATGDFGNSYIDGVIVDYVTGAARLTTGPLDDMIFYHGGSSSRSAMMDLYYAGGAKIYGTTALTIPVGTTAERPGTPAAGMMRFNTTTGNPEWYNATYTTWVNFADSAPYAIDYLVVAGGGGGGGTYSSGGYVGGGGGGAGGYIATTYTAAGGTAYTVTVGAGGAGGSSSGSPTNGSQGTSSVFSSSTAIGGGGGGNGSNTFNGGSGGSGGGGSGYSGLGGAGTSGQGNSGGNGQSGGNYPAGGGGGAAAAGGNATTSVAGSGGNGLNWQSLGTYYAGGGGGGLYNTTSNFGTGGAGGGGNGAGTGSLGSNATANTGGGGGGAGMNSSGTNGNGGSGIVIIRYSGAQRGTGGTVTSAGGYTYHTFTSSGTYTA